MPDLTPNIDLKKPLLTEAADIEVINENMDKIDSEIAKIRDSAKREHLADLFTNGIIPKALNELRITETDIPSKAIKIDTGKINFEGIVYTYDTETIISIDSSDALDVTNEPHTTDGSGALTLTYFPVSNQAEDGLAAITDIAVTKVSDGSAINVKTINPETGEVTIDVLNESVQVNYKSFSKRIDIVYVDTDGTLRVLKGNPVLPIFDPTVPSLEEGTFRLGEINLRPNFIVITNDMVKSDDVFYSINGLEEDLNEVDARMAELLEVSEIVTVGIDGGDFATINEALKYLTAKHPQYMHNDDLSEKFIAEIKLLSGFIVDELVHVQGINLSWIVITSEDMQVQLKSAPASGKTRIREAIGVFSAERGVFPTIGTVFALDDSATSGVIAAYHLHRQSKGRVLKNCGFKFEAKSGGGGSLFLVIITDQSMFLGDRGIYTNCLNTAVSVSNNSFAAVNNATITGNGQSIEVGGNSIVDASNADCTGYTTLGISVKGASLVYLMAAKGQKAGSNSTGDLKVELGGIVVAHNFTGGLSQTKNTLTGKGIIFQT